MAGAIIIGENNIISLSSIEFDNIIEKIRSNFGGEGNLYKDIIYEPVDEGGMSFISLKEQNEIGFNVFYKAAKGAYSSLLDQDLGNSSLISWQELIKALEADERCRNYV